MDFDEFKRVVLDGFPDSEIEFEECVDASHGKYFSAEINFRIPGCPFSLATIRFRKESNSFHVRHDLEGDYLPASTAIEILQALLTGVNKLRDES